MQSGLVYKRLIVGRNVKVVKWKMLDCMNNITDLLLVENRNEIPQLNRALASFIHVTKYFAE